MEDTGPVRRAPFEGLTLEQLYGLLRLRVEVFVVEQECAYPELDGRDAEAGTEHLWIEAGGEVVAALRILRDPDAAVIGRVVTRADHRGHGLAARLLEAALEGIGPARVRIGAQAHLEQWYAGFGFVRSGPDYLEDGIAHLPMVLEPASGPLSP